MFVKSNVYELLIDATEAFDQVKYSTHPTDETSKSVLSSDMSITVELIVFKFGISMIYNRTYILLNLFDLDQNM